MMAQSAKGPIGELIEAYLRDYPGEAVRTLELTQREEVARVVADVPEVAARAVLLRLSPDLAAAVLAVLPDESFRTIASGLDPARTGALLSRLDEPERSRRIELLDPTLAREIRELMSYPPDSAGGLMDPRATAFRGETRVGQALARLRVLGERKIHEVFVVEDEGRLLGTVPIQDLAVADPNHAVDTLMRPPTATVLATAVREEAVEVLTRTKVTTLPVVDVEGHLLGVIRHDVLVRAAQEEATADLQTMVGASKEERALSRPSFAVRKRLPWLQINLGTAFLAAAVVGLFEHTIAQYTALAVLLPVVAGQSGNTGSQALAVTMRALALREIRTRHWLRVALKEVTVGLVNGLAVGLVTAAAVYVWSRSIGLALVIGTAMILSMGIAGLSGASVPMVLTSVGQDPAQASSIILTTVTDVVGFFSFLGLATLLSGML
jgi:magnesium transporter